MIRTIGNYNPGLRDGFDRLLQQMDGLLSDQNILDEWQSVGYPPVNIGMTPEKLEIYLFSPGLDTDKLDISVQGNQLIIKGSRTLIREEGATYFHLERFEGEFQRIHTLPDDVDGTEADAHYEDGVLHISMPRRQPLQPKRIEIH